MHWGYAVLHFNENSHKNKFYREKTFFIPIEAPVTDKLIKRLKRHKNSNTFVKTNNFHENM